MPLTTARLQRGEKFETAKLVSGCGTLRSREDEDASMVIKRSYRHNDECRENPHLMRDLIALFENFYSDTAAVHFTVGHGVRVAMVIVVVCSFIPVVDASLFDVRLNVEAS